MSVLIKSNNALQNGGLGTVKMLGTTAQAQFDAYKARVQADGGFIKDEKRTLKAFNFLFDKKMYGNMNTAVSGTFGVKLDINGGITKLYAIDGEDLIGVTYGTGTLPKLDINNNIDFSANKILDHVNGGMFSTAQKIIPSRAGVFGAMLKIETFTEEAGQRLAGLTKHNDEANPNVTASISVSVKGELVFGIQTEPLRLTGTSSPIILLVNTAEYGYQTTSFISMPDEGVVHGFRGNTPVATKYGKPYSPHNDKFYLDFGGEYQSNNIYFGREVVRDFFCFAHATREQAIALNTFN